jgi:hypothetical protein
MDEIEKDGLLMIKKQWQNLQEIKYTIVPMN